MNHNQKKCLLSIGLVNLLIFGIGIAWILHGHQNDITLYDIPLYSSHSIYDDGDGVNLFDSDYPVSQYRFVGRTEPLQSGVYTITIYYTTDHDYYSVYCSHDVYKNPYPAVYSDTYVLNALYHDFSYRIWVNSKLDYLDICIKCGEDEEIFQKDSQFSLEKIEITRDYRTTIFYKTLKLLAFLILLNCIFCIFYHIRKIRENIYVVLGLACVFLVGSISVMGVFQPFGHDLQFHYARIAGLAEGLLSGNFPVKIQPGWLHDYGYASSVCYGDILLYIPAILYAFGVPMIHAYKVYILIINLGTLFISYFCFRKISRHKYIGLTCTALYCLSVNRLLNVYLRAAVGEYTAFMFLPLVILGIEEIYHEDTKKHSGTGWLFLSLGLTGIIQSHIISTEMVCLFILITVLALIRKLSQGVFFSFVKSACITLCLNLGFLLPLLDYMTDKLQIMEKRVSYGIQLDGLSIYELLSFGTTATGKACDSLNTPLGERIPESLGFAMLIMILLAVIVLSKCRNWQQHEKKILLSLTLSGIAILMSTYYFPWNRLAFLPIVQNIAASIQFPWRFISIAIPLLTYMSSLLFTKLKNVIDRDKFAFLLVSICLVSAFQGLYCIDLINRNSGNYILYDSRPNMDVAGTLGGEEYLLANTNMELTWTDLEVSGENIEILDTQRSGLHVEATCQAKTDAWIEFPLFAYKYYQCRDTDTGETYSITRGANNKIHVELPDNYQGTLQVDFVEPWHWRLAEIISLLSLLSVLIYGWRQYRHIREISLIPN